MQIIGLVQGLAAIADINTTKMRMTIPLAIPSWSAEYVTIEEAKMIARGGNTGRR
jgi:hypothetical protein